jgi:hypothetical protein
MNRLNSAFPKTFHKNSKLVDDEDIKVSKELNTNMNIFGN